MAVTNNVECTILNTAALSDAVPCFGATRFAAILPSAWTAAVLTVQCAWTDDTPQASDWKSFQVGGATSYEVSLPAAADRVVSLNRDTPLPSPRWIRLRSGTAAAPVTQGADRVIKLLFWDSNR